MCGHVGFVNRGNGYLADYDTWFKQALYCGALRGVHGTGIVGVSSLNQMSMYKRALAASDFLELAATKKIITGTNKALLGHNRYATQGGVSCENSHPFKVEHITLLHNGTLTSHRSLAGGNTFTVDSEALAAHLAVSETYKEALEEVDGAYALVWHNANNDTINFARNDDRALYLGFHYGKDGDIKTGQTIFYASEKGMLEWLCARNNIKLERVALLKPGVVLTVPLDIKEEISDSTFTPKEPKAYDYYQTGGYYGRGGTNGKKPESEQSSPRTNIVKRNNSYPTLKKYSYLLGVISLQLKITAFKPYQASGGYGVLCGIYNNDLEIQIGGQTKQDMDSYLGKMVKVTLTSMHSDEVASGRILGLADELPDDNEEDYEDYGGGTVVQFEKKKSTALIVTKRLFQRNHL